jgi:ribosomal protein S18 acetylase RimI-like enzyme
VLAQRPIDIERDRDFVLDLYCLRDWEDLPSWARNPSYHQYREGWLHTSEPTVFLNDLRASLTDERTVAEVWLEGETPVGFLWIVFEDLESSRVTFAEIRALVVSIAHQRRGIGGLMLRHAEAEAQRLGAGSIRSEMATENEAARAMHGKQGFTVATYQYEKILTSSDDALVSAQGSFTAPPLP